MSEQRSANLRRRRLKFLRRRRAKNKVAAMSMIEHLRELRTRLIYGLAAFVAISIAAFFFCEPILAWLLEPLCSLPKALLGSQGCELSGFGPAEPFVVRLKVTAMVGVVCSAPVWLYQVWAFVTPGLTAQEKKYALPFILSSVVLFAVGVTFAYLTLEPGLRFLIGLGEGLITPLFRADAYLNFVGLMFLGFGIAFELPLLLFFLGLAGVVTVAQLREHRRAAFVTIVALAAVVTPSQDPYTMLLMAVPLYLLYELTIILLRAVQRKKAA
jgi:sec-independent protein translocase protein TatC